MNLLLRTINQLDAEFGQVRIVRNKRLFKKYLNDLQTLLVNNFDEKRKEAINEAIRYLNSVGHDVFSKADANKVNKIISDKFGENLSKSVEKEVKTLNQKIYKAGIIDVANSVGMKLSFSVNDKRSAAVLASHNMFWIKDYYSTNLNEKISNTLTDYFVGGKNIAQIAEEFREQFKNITDAGKGYFELLADVTTGRVAGLGRVTGFEKAGVISYKHEPSAGACEICLELCEHVIEVSVAVEQRDKILAAESPEEIKEIAPFPSLESIKGVETKDLPAGSELSPFHPYCNCVAVAIFE